MPFFFFSFPFFLNKKPEQKQKQTIYTIYIIPIYIKKNLNAQIFIIFFREYWRHYIIIIIPFDNILGVATPKPKAKKALREKRIQPREEKTQKKDLVGVGVVGFSSLSVNRMLRFYITLFRES